MDKTKINYRKGGNGIRTSITLSTALVDTWLVAKGLDDEDLDTALAALRQAIEATPESGGDLPEHGRMVPPVRYPRLHPRLAMIDQGAAFCSVRASKRKTWPGLKQGDKSQKGRALPRVIGAKFGCHRTPNRCAVS